MFPQFSRLRRPWAPLAVILLLALAVRIFQLGSESFWYDELYALWSFRNLSLPDMVREQLAGGHLPLYYLVAKIWLLPGTSEIWFRLLSVTAGTITVWFTYLSGRELFSRETGLWGAAFCALSPFLVWYARAGTFYSLMIALSTLSLCLLIRSAKYGGWKNWTGYTVATAAVFLTYFYAAALIVAGAAIFLLVRDRTRGRLGPWLISQVLLLPPLLTALVLSSGAGAETSSKLHIPSAAELKPLIAGLVLSPFVLAGAPVDSVVNFTGQGHFPKGRLAVLAVILLGLALVAILYRPVRQRLSEKNWIALGLYTAALIAAPLTVQIMNRGLLHGRFYAWATPALMLLLAALVTALPRPAAWLAGITAMAGLGVLVIWELFFIPGHDTDWRTIMSEISTNQSNGDRVLCVPLHNCQIAADFYLGKPLPIVGGFPSFDPDRIFFLPPGELWTGYRSGFWVGTGATPALTGGDLKNRVASDIAGSSRVWVIATSNIFEDDPSFARALDESWQEKDSATHDFFELRLYVPKPATPTAAPAP